MSAKQPTKPYIAPPSVGHEIGVMFGFIAFMLLCMVAYGFAWNHGNRISQRKEAERIDALRASGLLREKGVGGEAEAEKVERV
ncbi:uncharacterized protein BDZ99DRAFT_466102 [Mytilinidion resinicola]|uniref:Uncharacterized protein n=1 Tax=Mytilinidion resinicola TaxID=574789 RepID=A0A6A6YCJ0_9PEZI|nr:uncharacterized protein BDZ99DRAFT_466102 [Mytilinidion resinicola]KAF2806532.1 hypothetical protein BDZ99DRAFT_466102 [Mytilinidion resinicola]